MARRPSEPTIRFAPSENCRLCAMIKLDPVLKAEIEQTNTFKVNGTGTNQLVDKYKLNKGTWYNHIRKHHYPILVAATPMELTPAVIVAGQSMVENELSMKENYEGVWDAILTQGAERIARGEVEVSGQLILKAAADKASYVSKKQDRKLDAAKMMFQFASGTKKKDLDAGTTDTATGDHDRGSD